MANVESINLGGRHEKWMKLMFHLQTSASEAFQLIFKDVSEAKTASRRMSDLLRRHPTWFQLVILQRDSCIYVIKTPYIKKVMIE